MTQEEMERVAGDSNNKSEKIRNLFRAGVPRGDIARFLDISYQHVQNVLKRGGLVGKAVEREEASGGERVYTVRVGAGGKITLPPEYVQKFEIADGEVLICREKNGGLTIMSRAAAVEVLREIARQRMPAEAGLLEALLASASSKSS